MTEIPKVYPDCEALLGDVCLTAVRAVAQAEAALAVKMLTQGAALSGTRAADDEEETESFFDNLPI